MRALAVTQMGQGQNTDAEQTLSKIAEQYPEQNAIEDATLNKAEAQLASGRWQEAARLFAEIAVTGKEGADYALLRRGLCLEQMEEFGEAAGIYQQLVKQFPQSQFRADAWLGAGRAYVLAQDTVNAERCLLQIATDNADTNMEIAHWRCRIKLYGGDPQQAVNIAKTALDQFTDAAWRVEVLLDEAEALALIPEKQKLAAAKYLEIAESLPDGELHCAQHWEPPIACCRSSDMQKPSGLPRRSCPPMPTTNIARRFDSLPPKVPACKRTTTRLSSSCSS